jgi:hypothetical protein
MKSQYCETGTAGTVTFFLSGTGAGTGMHYGSGSRSETGFGTGKSLFPSFVDHFCPPGIG